MSHGHKTEKAVMKCVRKRLGKLMVQREEIEELRRRTDVCGRICMLCYDHIEPFKQDFKDPSVCDRCVRRIVHCYGAKVDAT